MLSVARTGVLLVAAGLVLILVSGLWLVEETNRSRGDGWLAVSLLLLLVSLLLGAVGGRKARQARVLAASAPPDAPPEPTVLAPLRDRTSLAANLAAAASALAILVLMVWRPG